MIVYHKQSKIYDGMHSCGSGKGYVSIKFDEIARELSLIAGANIAKIISICKYYFSINCPY